MAALAFVSGLLGGCGDERPDTSAAPADTVAVVAALSAPRRSGCADGIVAPSGFAPITEIPTTGTDVIVQDVNGAGVVVGSQRMADGNWHAFRFTDRGGVQDLGLQPGFGTQSFATAVAEDGAVGGQSDRGDGTSTLFGFRFTDRGGRTDVCSSSCLVWDLDTRGRAVGLIYDATDASAWQAFLFSPFGGLRRLGTLGGARSSASGINDEGLVVGNAQLATSTAGEVGHAFVFDPAHGLRDLNAVANAPGMELQAATDIARGFITGYGVLAGATQAFLYDIATRGVRALGTPAGDGPSYGYGVNAHGDVVGYAVRDAHANDAVVYSANIGLRKVGDFVDPALGWDLQQADAINDAGLVVGWGRHQGAPRAFTLRLPQCGCRF
jgi:probable HAF family extracellular repeat protein